MSDPLLLLDGTHGYVGSELDTARWTWPGDRKHPASPWVETARSRGFVVALARPGLPLLWDSDLRGIGCRRWAGWKAWGDAVLWYALASGLTRVQLVGWSHGGNVACYAARRARWLGLTVSGLLTLGTPVRPDLGLVYRQARAGVGWWQHVYGGRRDLWQLAGEAASLWDMPRLAWAWACGDQRAMPEASGNLAIPACGHHELVDLATWDREDLWRFLR